MTDRYDALRAAAAELKGCGEDLLEQAERYPPSCADMAVKVRAEAKGFFAKSVAISAVIEDVKALKVALHDVTEDLAGELSARYDRTLDHPAMKSRFDRDMSSVVTARDLLGKLGVQS